MILEKIGMPGPGGGGGGGGYGGPSYGGGGQPNSWGGQYQQGGYQPEPSELIFLQLKSTLDCYCSQYVINNSLNADASVAGKSNFGLVCQTRSFS